MDFSNYATPDYVKTEARQAMKGNLLGTDFPAAMQHARNYIEGVSYSSNTYRAITSSGLYYVSA